MSDQCPTCGSHDPLYELVPVKVRTARIAVVLRCPDTWHEATEATAPNVEAVMSGDDLLLTGEGGVVRCTSPDVEQLIADGHVVDNGDGTVGVTEIGAYYIATRARFGWFG